MSERPYVVLSCAMSVDGYIDDRAPSRLILSGEEDLDRVDEVRANSDVIMVGASTVRRDNPRLVIRSDERRAARVARGQPENPVKVTVTTTGDLPPTSCFFTVGSSPRLVYCAKAGLAVARARLSALAEVVDAGDSPSPEMILNNLSERYLNKVLLEGGGRLATSFLLAGLVDEMQLVVAPFFVGDAAAPRFAGPGLYPHDAANRMQLAEVRQLGDVVLLRYLMDARVQWEPQPDQPAGAAQMPAGAQAPAGPQVAAGPQVPAGAHMLAGAPVVAGAQREVPAHVGAHAGVQDGAGAPGGAPAHAGAQGGTGAQGGGSARQHRSAARSAAAEHIAWLRQAIAMLGDDEGPASLPTPPLPSPTAQDTGAPAHPDAAGPAHPQVAGPAHPEVAGAAYREVAGGAYPEVAAGAAYPQAAGMAHTGHRPAGMNGGAAERASGAADVDVQWLRETIELSKRCPPSRTAFSVGAIIVGADGTPLATGYSRERDLRDHAEEVALAKIMPGDPRLATATLYSSLEPCGVRNSRPRPCADLIVAAGITRVVYAWHEPPILASGGGAEMLTAADVSVIEVPDLAPEARATNTHLLT